MAAAQHNTAQHNTTLCTLHLSHRLHMHVTMVGCVHVCEQWEGVGEDVCKESHCIKTASACRTRLLVTGTRGAWMMLPASSTSRPAASSRRGRGPAAPAARAPSGAAMLGRTASTGRASGMPPGAVASTGRASVPGAVSLGGLQQRIGRRV